MRHSLPLLLFATGCAGQARVAEEMRDGIVRVNEALAVALVAAEPASYGIDPEWSLEDGYRHPASGPCPSNEHDTEDPETFVSTLDYGDGCLPRSGLIATVVSGATTLEYSGGEVSVPFDGLILALAHPVSGTLSGSIDGDESGEHLVYVGELSIGGDGESLDARFDLEAALDPTEALLSGTVTLDGPGLEIRFDAVRLPYDAVRGECPTPVSGSATISGGSKEMVVDFGDPGGGEVIVTRGNRTSDPAQLCAFESWVFSG